MSIVYEDQGIYYKAFVYINKTNIPYLRAWHCIFTLAITLPYLFICCKYWSLYCTQILIIYIYMYGQQWQK